MNRKNNEKLLAELLRNDRVGEPDKAIEDRLMYSFMLKNADHRLRQNSMSGFAGWLFSAKSFGLKVALVSVVLFFSVANSQFIFNPSKADLCDTITSQRVLFSDTAHFIQNVDSIRGDSVN